MARLTKKDLKSILKECLKEILKEEGLIGLQQNNQTVNQNNLPLNKKNDFTMKNKALMENVGMLANVVSKDKSNLYTQILADTAMTTLQEQKDPTMLSGMVPAQEFYSEEQVIQDTESIQKLTEQFSSAGDITHWAKLAFAKKE